MLGLMELATDLQIVCASRHPPRPFGDLRRGGMHPRTTSCGCRKARPESLQNHGPEASGGSLLSSRNAVWTPRELFGTRWTLRGHARGAPEASRRRSGSAWGGPPLTTYSGPCTRRESGGRPPGRPRPPQRRDQKDQKDLKTSPRRL